MSEQSHDQNGKSSETFPQSDRREGSYASMLNIPNKTCPVKKVVIILKFKRYLLNQPYSSNIVRDGSDSLEKRVILLRENVKDGRIRFMITARINVIDLNGLPADIVEWIQSQKENGLEVITHNLDIDYKSYNLEYAEQILKMILPTGVDTNLRIDNIRDIKIVDLKEDQLKYEDNIGPVILEKSTLSHTVLLKERYTNPNEPLSKYFVEHRYQLLSGKPNTEIEITEGPCTYKLDLIKVFYESSFQSERERLLSMKGKDDIICDVFGDPFYSIRAAKSNHTRVIANCNNNESLSEFYNTSRASNEVESLIELSKKNVRAFVEETLSREFERDGQVLVGLFNNVKNQSYKSEENLPTVHFYILVPNSDFTDSMKKILTNHLNKIFNESFTNKEIKDIVEIDDFNTIFVVQDDFTHKKLLQCSLKLSSKIAYCPENLIDQIIPSEQNSSDKAQTEANENKIVEETKESIEVETTGDNKNEEKSKEGIEIEETESKPAEEQKNEKIATEEAAKDQTEPEAVKGDESQPIQEESKENKADEKSEATASKGKSSKKASGRKTKKELVAPAPQDIEKLEKEAEDDPSNIRRSNRKKNKSKQFEDFEY